MTNTAKIAFVKVRLISKVISTNCMALGLDLKQFGWPTWELQCHRLKKNVYLMRTKMWPSFGLIYLIFTYILLKKNKYQ